MGAQQPPTNFALLQAIETLESEREGKGLSRFYKPRYLPFACPKWDDLKEFIKRDSQPHFLQLRAVQEGGETVYN